MRDDIYSQLGSLYEGAARCKKIETMIEQMRLNRNKLMEILPGYKQALAKETLDVYELESNGSSSFLRSIFGNNEEKLKKERGEAVIARLKCRQVEKELEEINTCIENLETERKKLEGCGAEYKRLYKQKLQILLREHGPSAERVMELIEDIRKAKVFLNELKDAVSSGENALRYLRTAHDDLRKAESLGVFDMASGVKKGNIITGIIAGYDKYNHIDSAVTEVGIAQSAVNGFKSELAGISMKLSNPEMYIKPSGLLRYFDIAHDSLMVDWYAQKKIAGSLNLVNISKEDVQQKVTILKTLEYETQRRMDELKSKLDNIILGLKPDQERLSESIKGMLE